jgi:hypothetical protein
MNADGYRILKTAIITVDQAISWGLFPKQGRILYMTSVKGEINQSFL